MAESSAPKLPIVSRDSLPASSGAEERRGSTVSDAKPKPDVKPDERYQSGDEIARGGMGRVVEALDTRLGRRVAVKEVLSGDADLRKRFVRETKLTARLEHPAIVPVYDAGEHPDGTPFYVMRRVSGQPLADVVAETETLAQRLVLVPHVLAAAQAVAHAHHRGVVHRDVKPANILIGELGETVVIDWGFAKLLDEPDAESEPADGEPNGDALRTQAGAVFGTPGFMSPEQIAGTGVDERSDVYALGATLHYVLAGKAPHHRRSSTEMMKRAARVQAPPLHAFVPDAPRDLAWIVDKAIAFVPERRYRDAGELVTDLQQFLGGQLVATREYTAGERLVWFLRRHIVVVATVVLAVVALSLIGVLAIQRILDERAAKTVALAQAEAALTEMRLTQARTLLETDPSAAIALAQPLAKGGYARDVWAITSAARSAGAFATLPGPTAPLYLRMAPTGTLAASTDVGGAVWVHDLVNLRSRQVAQFGRGVRLAFARDRVIAYDDRVIAVLDADGNRAELPHAAGLRHVAATSRWAFVVAGAGQLERVEIAGGARRDLPIENAVESAPSPDEKLLAVATEAGLELLDLSGSAPPIHVGRGASRFVQWDPGSAALALEQEGDYVLVTHQPDGTWSITGRQPREPVFATVVDRGELYALERDRLLTVGGRAKPRPVAVDAGLAVSVTQRHALVFGGHNGRVQLVLDSLAIELRAPAELMRLAASPTSRFIVGASPGHLAVWNADAVVPQIATVDYTDVLRPAGPHHVLLGNAMGLWRWFDTATARVDKRFQLAPHPYQALVEPTGELAGLVANDDAPFVVLSRAQPKPLLFPGAVTYALLHPARITFGLGDGSIHDVALATQTGARLAAHPGPVRWLGEGGGWQSARWADGALWRRKGNVEQRGTAAPPGDLASRLHQMADGRTCMATANAVVCWNGDGTVTTAASLPADITRFLSVDLTHVAVALADHSLHYVDLASETERLVLASGGDKFDVIPAAHLGVTVERDGQLVVVDLETSLTWPLAKQFGASSGAVITPDGAVAIVVAMDQLMWWQLALPPTN